MIVDVLLFASYAEALGTSKLRVELSPGATVRDLMASIRALPGANRLPPAPLVAINQQYARADELVRGGDEVAVIPPVAGG